MITYVGRRDAGIAQVVPEIPLRLDLANHSSTGFEWGYGGSGPAQLALALLAHACGDEVALDLYQQFKWELVAGWPREGWSITDAAIREWAAKWKQ